MCLKIIDKILLVSRNIAMAALAMTAMALFLESVVRKLIGVSIIVTTEVGGIGMLFFLTLGLGWAYQQKAHLRIGFAVDRLPTKQLYILEFSLGILSLVLVGLAMYIWGDMTLSIFQSDRHYFMLRIVEWPFRTVGLVGWGILFIAIMERVVSQARQIFRKSKLDRQGNKWTP